MLKLSMKNSTEVVLIDERVYEELSQDTHLSSINFFKHLRRHSSGCVVFQKTYKTGKGSKDYRTETIYLHKLVAERYLAHQRTSERKLVGALNGNKMDCRLENLEYRTRAVASRKRKTSSKVGYTGVYQENNRFRAVISQNRRSIHIGMYATAEEAALAYNAKSKELFGDQGKMNVVPPCAHASSDEGEEGNSVDAQQSDYPPLRKQFRSDHA